MLVVHLDMPKRGFVVVSNWNGNMTSCSWQESIQESVNVSKPNRYVNNS